MEPIYRSTFAAGALAEKARQAEAILQSCIICPRRCGVNRLRNELGFCRTGRNAVVSSCHPHFGEEAPLVGSHGSGTVFFAYCSLKCKFCQNYEISHEGEGAASTDGQLARMMLFLQDQGCHNINFVTPSHVVPQILKALEIAVPAGLSIPLVYNTSAYDSEDTIKLLEGVIDIYMPDFKFWDESIALSACGAPDYCERACAAIREMHRQVGDLVVDQRGIAQRGLLVRHLVLPNSLAGTREVMRFIAREISADTYVNIMAQYRPCGCAREVAGLFRRITAEEFEQALQCAREEGLSRLDR